MGRGGPAAAHCDERRRGGRDKRRAARAAPCPAVSSSRGARGARGPAPRPRRADGPRVAAAGRKFVTSGEAFSAGQHLAARALGRELPAADTGTHDSVGLKPHTRFDGEVSAHRVVDAVGFTLADCKKIRQHVEGVTINDIFMAAVGGALRAYLQAHGELPDKTLNAMVPMTTRGEDKTGDAGNQIGMTALPLRTDIADPLERLQAVRRGSRKGKNLSATLGKDLPARLINVLPASLSARLMVSGLSSVANVTVSNVRGPDTPLYLAGAQLQLFLPVSIPFNGIGMNITGFSYNGTLWVCFVSCRQMIPDPAEFARLLNESFEDLVTAAIAVGPRPGSHAATAKRASASRKKRVIQRSATPRAPT